MWAIVTKLLQNVILIQVGSFRARCKRDLPSDDKSFVCERCYESPCSKAIGILNILSSKEFLGTCSG